MKVDQRIERIVDLAIAKAPELFASSPEKTITANKGPNKETGYTIFFNKGTGYDYSVIALMKCIFINFKKTESTLKSPKKSVFADEFLNKFELIFKNHDIFELNDVHGISKKPHKAWRVDVTDWDDDDIVNHMILLSSPC